MKGDLGFKKIRLSRSRVALSAAGKGHDYRYDAGEHQREGGKHDIDRTVGGERGDLSILTDAGDAGGSHEGKLHKPEVR